MANEQTRRIQTALLAKGFNPGTIDGIWGPDTRRAMNAWQIKSGMVITTTPQAQDLIALLGSAPAIITTGWIDEAGHLLGLKEGPGKANNPIIMEWGDDLDAHYTGDDVAWCGLFVAHCIRTALPDEPLPANLLGARQYQKFGTQVDPQSFAVGVFWRGTKAGWLGHVGFLVGQSATTYLVLGGNQSDSVNFTSIAKDRLLGAYWPKTGVKPLGMVLPARPQLQISTNEA